MLSYANPRDNIFKYKLDGFDKEYVLVDSQHRFASYNNLPAGIYTFHLQAAGGNGVWSSNERVLKVRILPAPWRSWWAVAFYLAALAGWPTARSASCATDCVCSMKSAFRNSNAGKPRS